MTLNRVVLSYVDDASETITLDVFVTEEGRIRPGWSVLGWTGKLASNNPYLYPFVIADIKRGEMDFGGQWEQDERFAELNIFEKKIAIGEYVTYVEGKEESTYRIAKLEKLGA